MRIADPDHTWPVDQEGNPSGGTLWGGSFMGGGASTTSYGSLSGSYSQQLPVGMYPPDVPEGTPPSGSSEVTESWDLWWNDATKKWEPLHDQEGGTCAHLVIPVGRRGAEWWFLYDNPNVSIPIAPLVPRPRPDRPPRIKKTGRG